MKHYYHPMSRAVTTDWLLTELDAPHEQIVVDYTKGETSAPEFRAINPMGKLPTLVDGDVVVTETAAICAYLADKFIDRGLAPAIDSVARGKYFRYLFYPGMTLEPMFTFNQLEQEGVDPASVGWGDLDRCLATIESMTPAEGWVLESGFSAADVVFGGTVDFAMQFGWLGSPTPKVQEYVTRIRSRDAYRATHDASWYE